MSDGLQIPEHLWRALELMEQEMGVPKNNLVCQAIFTLARLNGYVVAGQVPSSRTASETLTPPFPDREEPPPAPKAYAAPPQRTLEAPPSRAPEAPPQALLAREEASEAPLLPPQHAASTYASTTREEMGPVRRRSPIAIPPTPPMTPATPPPMAPPPPPPPPYVSEETSAPDYSPEEEETPEEEEDGAYSEAENAPLVLYIEVPGEEAVAMEGDEFIIGRGKTCNFVIDSNRVSRQHARVIRDADNFILEDLNSSNGTFFGKQREKISRRKIADGDEFIFGTERVTFYIQ